MVAPLAPTVAPAAAPVLVEVAANAAVRCLRDVERSRRARGNAALADVRPATSARDFARSSRARSQHAANETVMTPAAAIPAAQGKIGLAARAAGGRTSNGGADLGVRPPPTVRQAALSRPCCQQRRHS